LRLILQAGGRAGDFETHRSPPKPDAIYALT
jgi:hypothetical protein